MKKILLIIAMTLPILTFGQNKEKAPTKYYDLVIGTYTSGKSKGIVLYRFYTETGKLVYLNNIDDVTNPSYLCISSNNKFIYSVNELPKGEVSAFSFEAKTGKMEFINKQPSNGADPCHIIVDKAQKNVIVANYSSGALTVLPINKDGSLGAPSQTIHDEGKGADKERQEGPHVHMAQFTADEKYVLYNDLGTDKVNVMHYHATKIPPLTPAEPAFAKVADGNGPRHIEFSKDNKHVYLVTEMGSNVIAFDYKNGKLTQKQSITLLADGFKGQTAGAAIHLSPDGRFLYASNRLETNEIVIYAVNQQTGLLTFVGRQTSHGKNPRDFAIDPTGKFLIVANQDSDSIFVFRIDQKTGKLHETNTMIEVGNPVCLKFAPVI